MLEALSLEPPHYTLPAAQLFPSAGAEGSGALLVLNRPSVMHVCWPHVSLRPDELRCLMQLAAELPGAWSASDWLSCEVVHEAPTRVDAVPMTAMGTGAVESGTPLQGRGERVIWRCPLPSHVWADTRGDDALSDAGGANLLQALIDEGGAWASRAVHGVAYAVRVEHSRASRKSRRPYRLFASRDRINAARYVISPPSRPRITDALDISEVFHQSILSRYDDRQEPAPLIITGHEPNVPGAVSRRGHQHVFVLPEDTDQDGLLDHVLIYAQEPFPEGVIAALARIRTLVTPDWWPGQKRRWRVALEDLWSVPARDAGASPMPEDILVGPARIFVSITPYLHPWHAKQGGAKFGPVEQIRKELRLRGLPEPVAITPLSAAHVAGQLVPAHKFRRLRYGKRQNIPGRWGSFWRLEFSEPVYGPIALGANCHFGMGLFAAEADGADRAYSEAEDAEMT